MAQNSHPDLTRITGPTPHATKQLQATLNAVRAHAWYAPPTGALSFVNQRSAQFLGIPNDHHLRLGSDVGAPWDSHIPFLHPDDHEETRKVWSNCLRTQAGGEVSFRARDLKGDYRWFSSRAEPVRGADGRLLYWVGIDLEVEAPKVNEFRLPEAQKLSNFGSWAANSSGFTYWSSQLFEIHGLRPDVKAPSISEYTNLIHPDDRDSIAITIEAMLSNNQEFDFTKRIVRPDGVVRHVRYIGMPSIEGTLVGTGIDVTPHEELTRATRATGSSTANGPDRIRLRRVLDYINANLMEKLALEDLAGIARCSPFHFSRKFTLAMGISPQRYVSRVRLESAMRELAEGELSLAEIAFNAQYSSQASFTRAFHRVTGMTPKEYQRSRFRH